MSARFESRLVVSNATRRRIMSMAAEEGEEVMGPFCKRRAPTMTRNRWQRHDLPAGQECWPACKIRSNSARLQSGANTALPLGGANAPTDRRNGRGGTALYAGCMDLSEFPLLNRPALMLLMLK